MDFNVAPSVAAFCVSTNKVLKVTNLPGEELGTEQPCTSAVWGQ